MFGDGWRRFPSVCFCAHADTVHTLTYLHTTLFVLVFVLFLWACAYLCNVTGCAHTAEYKEVVHRVSGSQGVCARNRPDESTVECIHAEAAGIDSLSLSDGFMDI